MLNLTEIPITASSRKVYLNALANLDKWLRGRPITDETLADYLSYLFDRGKSPSHAEGVLKAVRWRAECEDKPDPRGKLCKRAIASFRRKGVGRGRGPSEGLQWESVEKLVSHATGERTIFGDRDAAIIAVMSDGLLRVSEVAALDVEDIDFASNTFRIRQSKTDQFGVGAQQYIGNPPLEHVRVWMEKAKVESGPLFRAINNTHHRVMKRRISPDTIPAIRRIIKKRAKAAGIDGKISSHSLRIGAAESLTIQGATLVQLQICGRWSSPEMPAHYARKHTAQQSAMARLRYGQ